MNGYMIKQAFVTLIALLFSPLALAEAESAGIPWFMYILYGLGALMLLSIIEVGIPLLLSMLKEFATQQRKSRYKKLRQA